MLINISNLALKYGSRYVLQNINLSLKSGEIVTIVGPNGSGKTTLFKAIIGTIPYAKGKIQFKVVIAKFSQKINFLKYNFQWSRILNPNR